MSPMTRSLVRHAHAIAREVGARVVFLHADVAQYDQDLADLIADVDFRVLLVSSRADFRPPEGWGDLCQVVRIPNIPMTRTGQVKVATLVATVEGLVSGGDRVLWLTGVQGTGLLDSILVLDLGTEVELFSATAAEPLPPDLLPEVFERVLTLAGELGIEGREGRPVGTLFVVGDSEKVLEQSRQLVINPFHGYPEAERNVLDTRLEETIKEFSALDGAFVIRGDGVILSAARYLVPGGRQNTPLPLGLGARHEAAVAISASTLACSICVSQSTGTISLFRGGLLVTDIPKPRSWSPNDL